MSEMNRPYQVCTRCVMDTSAPTIEFDSAGICNFCRDFLERSSNIIFENEASRVKRRTALIKQIKREGKGKKYDCIMGISGGVDSAYAIHLALQEGLRPLVVHMDNNWNSELAANNIKNLVAGLGVDLYTHVINWPEYKALMQAFFDADVIDVELLYDNAMLAVNYQQARKFGVKYILAGTNASTEGMAMPEGWNWFKWDKRNIKALGMRNGVKIKSFPSIGVFDYVIDRFLRRIKWISFLDFYDYQKETALTILEQKYRYKRYPYKHYESIFTRFYQGYILPEKFKVDKRRLHLSTLIASNQLDRDKALEMLEGLPYLNDSELKSDLEYFLKKMGWKMQVLDEYLSRPSKQHTNYPSDRGLWNGLARIYTRFS